MTFCMTLKLRLLVKKSADLSQPRSPLVLLNFSFLYCINIQLRVRTSKPFFLNTKEKKRGRRGEHTYSIYIGFGLVIVYVAILS